MNKNTNYSFIFYVYYILILALTLSDIFILNKFSSSIFYGLASAFIGIVLQIFYSDYKKQKDEIIKNVSNLPRIELLHEEEFYSHFRFLITNAKYNVDITHLSLHSPLQDKKPQQNSYYNDFLNLVQNNYRVEFRRVERISKDKIKWINKLIEGFNNQSNFSLFCLIDEGNKRDIEMSDYLSIQRIDEDHTFIVAILEHSSTNGKRDIYIRDKSTTNFFREYYNRRLVKNSISIINKGKVNIKEWNKIKGQFK